jgi:malate dehydrogenase (oxaloacetate-decarboxylating)
MSAPSTVTTPLTGIDLLDRPLLNKGTAFSADERRTFGLAGLLPPHVDTLEEQTARAYEAYCREPTDLDRHILLRGLQDTNETLFYRLMLEHTAEMMPIVYTPVVGLACQTFSHIYRKPRGVFVAYPERDRIDEILGNVRQDVRAIVVTDGERILGLGDQGAGGMGIPIGKLSLYSLVGGINPADTLPMLLDLGTNNQERLNDPRYLGWRHERIKGEAYDDFIDRFVGAVMRRWPDVLLQWEDFASADAERILARYRDRLCTFNDDIQGTATVVTGTLLAAMAATGIPLADQRLVMLGAGSAGVGIAEQLVRAFVAEGVRADTARRSIYVVDIDGLLHDGRGDLDDFHKPLARKRSDLAGWDCDLSKPVAFADVVRNARPTALVGATGQKGAFAEAVVREMAAHTPRPIIFPLSNPTDHAEATPADLLTWTDGRALTATGSPFAPVTRKGVVHAIAQCNNSYVFPAMGLGVLASGARRVTDEMFMAAAFALRDISPSAQPGAAPGAPLLPSLDDVRTPARQIAIAVARQAQAQGVAAETGEAELERRVDATIWTPVYPKLVPAAS